MAKTSSNWDLSDGMDVDYSGNKEVAAADRSFREAQSIIDNAYNIDREGETQQSTIDAINAKNKAYIDTVDLDVELKNAKNQATLDDYEAKNELEDALQAAEGYATDNQPEVINPEKREQDGWTEEKVNGIDTLVPRYKVTPEQRTPATQTQRPRTQLERLKAALPLLTSPSARTAAQEAIRKEITNQAYQLHAFEPDQALKMLRENGLGVSTSLERTGDGTFKQVLSDGQIKTYSQLDASAMVGDIIKGSNDLHKAMVARQTQAAAQARQDAKDAAALTRQDAKDKASEAREDIRYQRAVDVAQVNAQAKVGAGRYGRASSFDADGNLIVGGAGGGGGGGGLRSRGGSSASEPVETTSEFDRITGEQSVVNAPVGLDYSKLTYEQAVAVSQTANTNLSKFANSKTSPQYVEAKRIFDAVAPILEARKNQKRALPSTSIDPSVSPGDMPKRTATQGDKEYKASLETWANQKMRNDQYIREKKATDARIERNLKAGIKL